MAKRVFCSVCNKMKRAGHSHDKNKPKTEIKSIIKVSGKKR